MNTDVETKPAGEEGAPGTEVATPPPEGSQEQAPPDEREVENQRIRDENAQLKARLTEQATVIRTLDKSYANKDGNKLEPDKEIGEIEAMIETNPSEAMRRMVRHQNTLQANFSRREAALLEKSRAETTALIEQNRYVNDIKSKDPDIAHYDKFLGAAARELMTSTNPITGQPYTWLEAVNTVTAEFKKTRREDPLAKKGKPAEPAPTGARGETGSPKQPTPPPPEKVETTADIVAKENARLAQKRRGK